MELLSGYTLDSSLFEFFIYLFEQETEEKLWTIWINKDIDKSFESFRKEALKQNEQRKMNRADEERALDKAESILGMTTIKEITEVNEIEFSI